MTGPLFPPASFLGDNVTVAGWPGHIAVTGPALPETPPPKDWPEDVRLIWLVTDTRSLFLWFAPSEAWLPIPATEELLATVERLAQAKAA